MENQAHETKEPINNEGTQQAEQKQKPILLTTIGRVISEYLKNTLNPAHFLVSLLTYNFSS